MPAGYLPVMSIFIIEFKKIVEKIPLQQSHDGVI